MTKITNAPHPPSHRVASKYGLTGGKRGGKRFSTKAQKGLSYMPIYVVKKLIPQAGATLTTEDFKLGCRELAEQMAQEIVKTSLLFRKHARRQSKLKPEDVREACRFLEYPLYT